MITAAQKPGITVEFDTFDETGHTGTTTGVITSEFGMAELGNLGFAVIDATGQRHNVSRYAYVIPQKGKAEQVAVVASYNTGDRVGTVLCENCDSAHPAEYSHESPYGGHDVFAVVCTVDWLTSYYTAAGVRFQ
jgi:hypothetical protein